MMPHLHMVQVGPYEEDLVISNDAGRVRLDDDQVGLLITYLLKNPTYREWIEEDQQPTTEAK